MRHALFLTTLWLAFSPLRVFAADDAKPVQTGVVIERADLAARKKLIHDNLPLTETESQAFWPLYEAYEKQLKQLGERRSANLGRLGENFEAMSEENAAKFIRENLKMQSDRLKITSQYFKELEQVLSGKNLARYYQIEYQIRATIDARISESIPLIK
ncbi:hypothetical protein RP726_13720 [Candidatus Methylospira mobilis]|uniref:hypothetical protein n=1 Tax=Candidatus Methylospira mobilis TaxID=1808979 RepID=UPI0028E618E2|nr:hypothetical protein [Candidatus Methylospira mobilis]WNV03506.1 hypothetical protein RP726_13720 [Candidatus Methylospira mobilis]